MDAGPITSADLTAAVGRGGYIRGVDFALRPATDGDLDFLFELHEASLRDYVEETWGVWDEEDQRRRYLDGFTGAGRTHIVVVGGEDAGMLRLQQDRAGYAEELVLGRGGRSDFLELIEIAPEFRGQRVGTSIIWDLQGQAAAASRPLTLSVLRVNPRAKALFERIAFRVTSEQDIRFYMRWDPRSTPAV